MNAARLFWLAPVLPLAAFILLAAGLSRLGRLSAGLAIAAIGGATAVSTLALLAAAQGARAVVSVPWLVVGGRELLLALWLDPLGALLAVLVAVVALVVFVYAVRYMAGDPRFGRFFALLSLFAGAMLVLVLAADLLTLFIAWELVGLCSFLLIGFWFERPGVPAAATKAFLTTRVADLAMLAGLLLLAGTLGRTRIDVVLDAASRSRFATGFLLAIALLLFAGAAGKSAQIPFQGWLPDAMAGPTPVSALIHSATMVAAGVFLVARLHLLFAVAKPALVVVAWVGIITALVGGTAALVEKDLKRTLAYSTMSQLGLMFVGLGAGSLIAGVLLLVAQALYKASLFLAAGVIDHAVEGTAFDRMGGLARRMPLTFVVFALSAAALAGLPVTLALPPKDPVLAAAWRTNPALFAAALLASFITALYSARAFGLVFLGPASKPAQEAHSSGHGLLVPLLALTALVPIGLLIDAPLLDEPLGHLLDAATPEAGIVTALTLGMAVLGVLLGLSARYAWPRDVVWAPIRPLAPLFAGEFGLGVLYRALPRLGLQLIYSAGRIDRTLFDPIGERSTRVVLGAARRVAGFDHAVFDAVATRAAAATLAAVRASARFDLQRIDAAATTFGRTLANAGERLRRLQTGRIENYLLAIFVWGLGLLALAMLVMR
ncbi:MAG: NADH-quinone oxidoreductase subunit L [Ardenticatenaceae bacterium]|nr:NADH-quinone oxidoreductase subunit L [Ardenticatenaceae bacterium]